MEEPRVRAGVPAEVGDPGDDVPRPAVDPALIRPVPARRVGDLVRRLRARRPADPDAEPTFGRVIGQFGLFAMSILAIMVVLVLPCVLGIMILNR